MYIWVFGYFCYIFFPSIYDAIFNIRLGNMVYDELEAERTYHNVPRYRDRSAYANNVDQDQTAPERAVWSWPALFAISSENFDTLLNLDFLVP